MLITGATGFIGSHVARRLAMDATLRVVAIVRKEQNYKNTALLQEHGIHLIEGQFYDAEQMAAVFDAHAIDHIIHIAAMRGGGAGSDQEYQQVNIRGTEILLNLAQQHEVKRFIYCSSVGVFGSIPVRVPATLDTPLQADGAYHASKLASEQLVLQAVKEGLDGYIVRPTITYGPGDDGFPQTLVKLVQKRMLLVPFRDVKIHLADVAKVADMFYRLVTGPAISHRIFIAADEKPITLKEIANLIYRHFYGKDYPGFLRMPDLVYRSARVFFSAIHNDMWLTRIRLISESWYYDIRPAIDYLNFEPANTSTRFIDGMGL